MRVQFPPSPPNFRKVFDFNERTDMHEIFPNLFIGNRTDAYMALFVHTSPGESIIGAVLDISHNTPSRKWQRAKHIALSKVGFVNGSRPTTKIQKALDFIHEQRKVNKAVLILEEPGNNTADLLCIMYFMVRKDLTYEEAIKKVEQVRGKIEMTEQDQKSISKFTSKNGG